jgi:hypothetical protein
MKKKYHIVGTVPIPIEHYRNKGKIDNHNTTDEIKTIETVNTYNNFLVLTMI